MQHAIESDDIESVKALIAQGVSVHRDHPDEDYITLADSLEMTKLLFDHGADASKVEAWKQRFLGVEYSKDEFTKSGPHHMRYHAYNGHIEVVKLLLSYGVDQNADGDLDYGTDWGVSPLAAAADRQNIEMMKLLLDNGADMSLYDYHALTNLLERQGQDDFETVALFVKYGLPIRRLYNWDGGEYLRRMLVWTLEHGSFGSFPIGWESTAAAVAFERESAAKRAQTAVLDRVFAAAKRARQ